MRRPKEKKNRGSQEARSLIMGVNADRRKCKEKLFQEMKEFKMDWLTLYVTYRLTTECNLDIQLP